MFFQTIVIIVEKSIDDVIMFWKASLARFLVERDKHDDRMKVNIEAIDLLTVMILKSRMMICRHISKCRVNQYLCSSRVSN